MKTALLIFAAAMAWPDTGQVAPPPAPIVYIWGTPGCSPCRQAKYDVQQYAHLDFRYSTAPRERPAWLVKLMENPPPEAGFPVIVWYAGKKRGYVYRCGWYGLSEFIETYNRSLK